MWVASILPPLLAASAAVGFDATKQPPVAAQNSIGMTLVRIPAGEFQMGSPLDERGRKPNEGPQHHVRITRAFEMGAHEVTVGQFGAFVEATGYRTEAERDVAGGFGIDFETAEVVQDPHTSWRDPGFPGFTQGPGHPVLMVSWSDAEAFCRWLSAREGREYRLPTEAEWEYAARAGAETAFVSGSDEADLLAAANVADRSLRERVKAARSTTRGSDGYAFTAPVGRFRPNAFGLYDTAGNVWEWCNDWHADHYYAKSPVDDPRGPPTGSFRAIRGGGWWNPAAQARVAQRIYFKPSFRYCLLSGFRVVRELPR